MTSPRIFIRPDMNASVPSSSPVMRRRYSGRLSCSTTQASLLTTLGFDLTTLDLDATRVGRVVGGNLISDDAVLSRIGVKGVGHAGQGLVQDGLDASGSASRTRATISSSVRPEICTRRSA